MHPKPTVNTKDKMLSQTQRKLYNKERLTAYAVLTSILPSDIANPERLKKNPPYAASIVMMDDLSLPIFSKAVDVASIQTAENKEIQHLALL